MMSEITQMSSKAVKPHTNRDLATLSLSKGPVFINDIIPGHSKRLHGATKTITIYVTTNSRDLC